MFKKILMPVDLGGGHDRSLEIAVHLARGGGEIILLHVIELILGLSQDEGKAFYGKLEQKAREVLDSLGSRLESQQITWRGDVVFGDRTKEVIRQAQEMEADLIVLRSHRVNLAEPGAGWGTLSYKLGILSPCPVLLVK